MYSLTKNKEILPDIIAHLALDYYSEIDIAEMYNVPEVEVRRIAAMPLVQQEIIKLRSQLKNSGESFKKLAKIYVEEALPYVQSILANNENKPAERLAAAEFMLKSSGLAVAKESPIVNINLNTIVQEATERKNKVIEMRDYL